MIIKRWLRQNISLWKIKWSLVCKNLNPLHLTMVCANLRWICPSGSGENVGNVFCYFLICLKLGQWFWRIRRKYKKKIRKRRRTTYNFWSENPTWAFGSGEVKYIYCFYYTDQLLLHNINIQDFLFWIS